MSDAQKAEKISAIKITLRKMLAESYGQDMADRGYEGMALVRDLYDSIREDHSDMASMSLHCFKKLLIAGSETELCLHQNPELVSCLDDDDHLDDDLEERLAESEFWFAGRYIHLVSLA